MPTFINNEPVYYLKIGDTFYTVDSNVTISTKATTIEPKIDDISENDILNMLE